MFFLGPTLCVPRSRFVTRQNSSSLATGILHYNTPIPPYISYGKHTMWQAIFLHSGLCR